MAIREWEFPYDAEKSPASRRCIESCIDDLPFGQDRMISLLLLRLHCQLYAHSHSSNPTQTLARTEEEGRLVILPSVISSECIFLARHSAFVALSAQERKGDFIA